MDIGGSLVPECHLINAAQYPHRLCGDSSWLDWVDKKPPVKADLAIYGYIDTVSGQYVLECGYNGKQ